MPHCVEWNVSTEKAHCWPITTSAARQWGVHAAQKAATKLATTAYVAALASKSDSATGGRPDGGCSARTNSSRNTTAFTSATGIASVPAASHVRPPHQRSARGLTTHRRSCKRRNRSSSCIFIRSSSSSDAFERVLECRSTALLMRLA